MTCCSDVHKQFDKFADGKVQVGELPKWMHVSGKVAWNVFQEPYSELDSNGFSVSGRDMGKQNWRWMSPCARDSSGVYARNMSFRHTHTIACAYLNLAYPLSVIVRRAEQHILSTWRNRLCLQERIAHERQRVESDH